MTINVTFAVTETGAEAAAGDYFTALELGQALQLRFGWKTYYRSRSTRWYELCDVDVLIVMVDEYVLSAIQNAKPNLVTVAWARNWFERWAERPWICDYDVHLCSSLKAVDFLSTKVKKRARLLRVATNLQRFTIQDREKDNSLDFVFTGSYWQSQRDVIAALTNMPARYRGAIYGKNWEQVSELTHLYRGFVSYDRIHEIYKNVSIVIDDSNHVTNAWGAANSRVFDALASGCLVISNSHCVSNEVFGGLLPVYDTPKHLELLLDRYIANQPERSQLQEALRKIVLERHSYKHRALELIGYLCSYETLAKCLFSKKIFGINKDLSKTSSSLMNTLSRDTVSSKNSLVSFIIPVFNNLAATREMLSSLQASLPQWLKYEIIIIDDASTDGTGAWLNRLVNSKIKVLKHKKNRGFARSNNEGVRLAKGEVLGLLNNDLVFTSGWFEPMLAILESSSLNTGLVGNVQCRVSDGHIDHIGIEISPEAQFFHQCEIVDTHITHRESIAVTGACILIRRADFEAVDGFDETFVNGAEDIDLCYKLRALGKSIRVATRSTIKHHVSLSRKRNTDQDLRNSRQLFSKWGKEIRRDLVNVWRRLLIDYPTGYRQHISGELVAELLASPNLLAILIARMMIDREQAEWVRCLQDPPDTAPRPIDVTWCGLVYDANLCQYVLGADAEFFARIDYASNFYICGAAVDTSQPQANIEITVNTMQRLNVTFDRRKQVNVGIVGPLILPGINNVFRVSATTPLIVTHIVINDQRVDL